jgi:hypothetical protein
MYLLKKKTEKKEYRRQKSEDRMKRRNTGDGTRKAE